ncbi:hypothetical protein D3C78_859580 [compost metagenome]
MGQIRHGLFEHGALVLDQRGGGGGVLATGEHAGDAEGHLPHHRIARGDAAEAHGVVRVVRIGGIEHFQVELGAGQVAFRAAAFQRKLGADLLPTITRLAEQILVGNEHVFEEHFVEVMLADHVVDRSDGNARRLQVDDQLGQAGMAILLVLRAGAQQGHQVVRAVSAGGPDLLAVHTPATLYLLGAGAYRGQVGTDIRFRETDSDEYLTAGHAGADLRREHVRGELHEQRCALALGDPVGLYRRARGEQFFQHHVALQRAALMAAIALRPGHAEPAARAQLAAELFANAVPALGPLGGGVVLQRFGEERAHLGAQGLGVGVQATGSDVECLHGCLLT